MAGKPDARCCSFCRKSFGDVKKIIAQGETYICNECVIVCVEALIADAEVIKFKAK